MSRSILKIQLPDGPIEAPILKVIKLPVGLGFLVGTLTMQNGKNTCNQDFSDHEFWTQLPGESVKLFGTFKEATFDKLHTAKARAQFELGQNDFEWTNTNAQVPKNFAVEIATVGMLKLDLSNPFPGIAVEELAAA